MKIRLIKIVLYLALICGHLGAFAAANQPARQNNSDIENLLEELLAPKKQELENKIEDRARQILSTQLDTGTYLVTVTSLLDIKRVVNAAVRDRSVNLKTLARRLTPEKMADQFVSLQTTDTLQPFIKKIVLKLSLDKQVPKSVENLIISALNETLGLDKKRGDQILVTRAVLGTMTTSRQQQKLSEMTTSLNKAVDEKHSLEIKVAAYETQKLQLEEQVRLAHDEAARSKESYENQIAKLNDDIKQLQDNALSETTFLGKVRRNIKGFEMIVTFVPVAMLVILGLVLVTLLFVSSQGKRSRTLFDGMQIVATALQKAGLGGGALNALSTQRKAVEKENSAARDASPQLVGEGAFELARHDADDAWSLFKQNAYPLLAVLKDWLATPEGVLRFLGFSDAIGFERAREIWTSFSSTELEVLSTHGQQSIPKTVGFGNLSQALRLAESFRALQPSCFAKLDLNFLIRVKDSELANSLSQMGADLAGFAFAVMTQERSKRVLSAMIDPPIEELFANITALKNVDDARAQQLAAELQNALGNVSEGNKLNLTALFANLIEGATPEQKRRMVQALDQEENLASEVRERVISIEDVLTLDKDILSEMFEPLETNQVAELVFTLPSDLQGVVAGLLTQKMMFDVQQELSRFRDKPSAARRAQVAGRKLQEMLCDAVKAQVEAGLIELRHRNQQQRQAS